MSAIAHSRTCIVATVAFACAACGPSATSEADRAAMTAPTAVAQPTDTTIAETAYPPPMLTAKSVEATEMTSRQWTRETAAATGRDKPITATDMVRYANPVLGLSFAYPRELGEVEFDVWPGETGEAWQLLFSRFNALSLAGVSPDFSEGRGGMFEDSYGYARGEDGSVLWLEVPARSIGGKEIEVEESVTSQSGVENVLFLLPPSMGAPDSATPGPPAALVNLAGGRFPGLIVLSDDPARLPSETLRAILTSIEVGAPIQMDGTAGDE